MAVTVAQSNVVKAVLGAAVSILIAVGTWMATQMSSVNDSMASLKKDVEYMIKRSGEFNYQQEESTRKLGSTIERVTKAETEITQLQLYNLQLKSDIQKLENEMDDYHRGREATRSRR